jgi:steroid 5-alpha reductase family enzyme
MILAALPFLLALFALTWAASVVRRDASLADRVWGLGFVLLAWQHAWWTTQQGGAVDWLPVVLVTLWGLRLALHITYRNWDHGEDRRYRAMRERNGPRWWLTSLWWVFGLQAVLCAVIALPLAVAIPGETTSPLRLVGATVWTIGFLWEAIGDWQLLRFIRDPDSKGQVLDTGLWRYSRHPNYFGEIVCWWGLWVMTLPLGGWWTALGPLTITGLLVRVSGVTLLEADIGTRRPGYAEYVRRTNALIPGPRRG